MSNSLELFTNPLLQALKPRPDDQRQFIILHGYIDTVTEQTVTIYPDLDLRCYLEIPRGEIVWAERSVPGQQSSPTKLVVSATASINRVVSSQQVEAGYLKGAISSKSLSTSAAGLTVNILVENEDKNLVHTTPCRPLSGVETPSGTGGTGGTGGTSNCHLTGVCVSDPIYPHPYP